jgi:hypothetical protein
MQSGRQGRDVSPGSQVVISNVSQIVIYEANPTTGANDQGLQDVWTYSPGAGPIPLGSTDHLNFVDSWRACSRSNALPSPNSIGVSLTYTYSFQTPLASVMRFFGGAGSTTLTLTDKTVMTSRRVASRPSGRELGPGCHGVQSSARGRVQLHDHLDGQRPG